MALRNIERERRPHRTGRVDEQRKECSNCCGVARPGTLQCGQSLFEDTSVDLAVKQLRLAAWNPEGPHTRHELRSPALAYEDEGVVHMRATCGGEVVKTHRHKGMRVFTHTRWNRNNHRHHSGDRDAAPCRSIAHTRTKAFANKSRKSRGPQCEQRKQREDKARTEEESIVPVCEVHAQQQRTGRKQVAIESIQPAR